LLVLKKFVKFLLPESGIQFLKSLRNWFKLILFKIKLFKILRNYRGALAGIQNKNKIKIVFFLIHHADWKYDSVYHLLDADKRFEPVVVVCPYALYGEEFMLNVMGKAYEVFKKDGYNVVKSFDKASGKWLDVKKELQPDVVCFTSPWKLTRLEYQLDNFLDTLTCYVPYGYETSHLHKEYYNGEMQNFVWRFFLENNFHKALSEKYSGNKGNNVVVTGYPGMDRFQVGDKKPNDVWKIKDKRIKRVIWAPHHSIPGMGASLDYSTFMEYHETMLLMADRFKNEIQFAFKPHPILKEKLSNDEIWGRQKAGEYFQKWENLNNGQLEEGDYMDLFFTSDAIIHDCGSFVAEYLYTGKPVLYLMRDQHIYERFNEVGQMALKTFYQGYNVESISWFLQNVVLGENDTMKIQRDELYNNVIKAPGPHTASENIYRHLVSEFFTVADNGR
jgi:hypothetical protein